MATFLSIATEPSDEARAAPKSAAAVALEVSTDHHVEEDTFSTSPESHSAPSPELPSPPATQTGPAPPTPAQSQSQGVVLKLLQRASRSPEELLEGAYELSLVGLLSAEALGGLCKSMGLADDQAATVLLSQKQALVRRQGVVPAVAGVAAAAVGGAGGAGGVGGAGGAGGAGGVGGAGGSGAGGAAAAAKAAGITGRAARVNGDATPPPFLPVSIRSLLDADKATTLTLPPSAVEERRPSLGAGALGPLPLPSPTGGGLPALPSAGGGMFLGSPNPGLGTFGVTSRLASEWHMLGRLGSGGGGAVYRARHRLDGGEYALKRVFFWARPGAPAGSDAQAQRVLREVQALARLDHPNVCRYYSAWIETDWASFFSTVSSGFSQPPSPPKLKLIGNKAGASAAGPSQQPQSPLAVETQDGDDGDSSGLSDSQLGGEDSPDSRSASASCSGPPSGGSGSSGGGGGGGGGCVGGVRWAVGAGASRSSPTKAATREALASLTSSSRAQAARDAAVLRISAVDDSDADDLTVDSRDDDLDSAGSSWSDTENSGYSDPFSECSSGGGGGGGGGGVGGQPAMARQWSYRMLLCIQMELCETKTLRHYLEARDGSDSPAVDEALSLEYVEQIVSGLEHVHACGLVHRDLKPSNCCFSGGRLKLMDFGLAKAHEDADGGATGAGGKLSGREILRMSHAACGHSAGVGTASYAAPEQMSGGAVLAACDLFPLGLIIYELFNPFGSAMERAKEFGQLRSRTVPAHFARRWPRLAPLLSKLLAPDPLDRPQCSDALKAVRALRRDQRVASAATATHVSAATATTTDLTVGENDCTTADVASHVVTATTDTATDAPALDLAGRRDWRDELIARQSVELRLLRDELRRAEARKPTAEEAAAARAARAARPRNAQGFLLPRALAADPARDRQGP